MEKPKFNPNADFQVAEAPVKPKFDPSQPHDVVPSLPQAEAPNYIESLSRGLLQGGTLGFSDEATGGIEALVDAIKKGDVSNIGEDYTKHIEESRQANAAAEKANPITYKSGDLLGMIAPFLVSGGAGAGVKGAALVGGGLSAANSLGKSENQTPEDATKNALISGAVGAGTGAAAEAVAPEISSLLSKYLRGGAEKLAVKATGATAAQAKKFAPEAGAELLDKGFIQPLSTSTGLVERLTKAAEESGTTLNQTLADLSAQGGKVNKTDIVKSLEDKIAELGSNPGEADVVKKLSSMKEDIIASPGDSVSLTDAEAIKRSFGKNISNWMDPEKASAAKTVYGAYKNAVEDSATQMNPEVANQFLQAKKDYGLIAPLKDATENTALKSQQSPFGGFSDTADLVSASTLGGGNGVATAGLLAAKKAVLPMAAQTLAYGANTASGVMSSLGELAAPASIMAATRVNPADQSKHLYSMNNMQLNTVANHLASNPSTKIYADSLQDAIARGDEQRKNATLFSMLQNPTARDAVSSITKPQE